jgi:acylphosphatase
MNPQREGRHVIYRGAVQGVGFRFTALRIARQFPVQGYVRNLPDGSVELVAVGAAQQLRDFLAAVAEAMRGNIERAEESPLTSPEEYTRFEIRH